MLNRRSFFGLVAAVFGKKALPAAPAKESLPVSGVAIAHRYWYGQFPVIRLWPDDDHDYVIRYTEIWPDGLRVAKEIRPVAGYSLGSAVNFTPPVRIDDLSLTRAVNRTWGNPPSRVLPE